MIGQPDTLILRDIHQTVAPPWWPPAPGWWIVAAIVVLLLAIAAWFLLRRRRHRRAVEQIFDDAMRAAASPSAQVAVMSELLRRSARRQDREADRLQGDAWLQFLDRGAGQPPFAQEAGHLLLEGGFRRELDAADVAALLPRVRARFLELMQRPRRSRRPWRRLAGAKAAT